MEAEMRIPESCADCLFKRQKARVADEDYINKVKALLDNRRSTDTSPFMVYQFNRLYAEKFGKPDSYADINKKFNDLVLSMENQIREKIHQAADPLYQALVYAQVGNYIDFGAMNVVNEDEFLKLLDHHRMDDRNLKTYESFVSQCEKADTLLLLCDNCGEIVFDKLLLEEIKKRFPRLSFTVMIRGEEVLNDATRNDAAYVGIDKIARIVDNGMPIAGTVYEFLGKEAKEAIDQADVILSKGQGNYEAFSGEGKHVFYAFLCKCELFTNRFGVERLTGLFIEEGI